MTDLNLYKLHAGICNILSNPKRLEIIDSSAYPRNVSDGTGCCFRYQPIQPVTTPGVDAPARDSDNTTRGIERILFLEQSQDYPGLRDLMRQVLLEHLEAGKLAETARK